MSIVYKIHELANIDDPLLLKCCLAVQDMRRILSDFMQHIVSQLGDHPVTLSIRVALAVVNRVAEGSLSIEILCMKNRVRDAAILLLSLYELQLDLQYIAQDPSRAETWIDHCEQDKKPWRIASQLREIYTIPSELKAERRLYRTYSMAKHGNPIGTHLAFPLSATRHTLILDTDTNNPMIRAHTFVLGVSMVRAGTGAASIWSSEGLDVGDFITKLDQQCEKLSKYNEEYIVSRLQQTAVTQTPDEESRASQEGPK